MYTVEEYLDGDNPYCVMKDGRIAASCPTKKKAETVCDYLNERETRPPLEIITPQTIKDARRQ